MVSKLDLGLLKLLGKFFDSSDQVGDLFVFFLNYRISVGNLLFEVAGAVEIRRQRVRLLAAAGVANACLRDSSLERQLLYSFGCLHVLVGHCVTRVEVLFDGLLEHNLVLFLDLLEFLFEHQLHLFHLFRQQRLHLLHVRTRLLHLRPTRLFLH